MNNTLTTLRAALSALYTGSDAVRNYAESVHANYKGYYPERHAAADRDVVEVDKAIADLTALIASMEAQPAASPVMLKVVRGDICCKSLDMDQSYGMWVPVTYSAEHGFVDGTCFYTTAQPSEPKAEAAHDDLTIAYMSGFHDGKKAKAEPAQEPVGMFCEYEEGCFEQMDDSFAGTPLYAAPQARKPLKVHEIAKFAGTEKFGPDELKWFRMGEAAHGIEGGAL